MTDKLFLAYGSIQIIRKTDNDSKSVTSINVNKLVWARDEQNAKDKVNWHLSQIYDGKNVEYRASELEVSQALE